MQFLCNRLIIACLALGLASCGDDAAGPAGGPSGQALPVTVSSPTIRNIVEWDEYTGRFAAIESVEIRARVSGYLDSINFEDGADVAQGDLLFVIDPRPYEAILAQSDAEIARAQAAAKTADLELERGKELLDRGAVSQGDYDRRLQSKLQADASVRAAEAALRRAQLDVEFTQIRAPIAGRISQNYVSRGNLISGGETGGTLLTTIVSIDPIEFEFTASEADYLKYVRLGLSGERPSSRDVANPVQLRLADEDEFLHSGFMSFVDNRLDISTGTMLGRATFENPEGLFAPGMFARLRLLGSGRYDAVLIPDEAILTDQTQKFVWVVGEGNLAEFRPVTPGPIVDGLRVVRSGLSGDDRVVVTGVQFVRPGAPLAPQEAPASAAPGASDS